MKLYKTNDGILLLHKEAGYILAEDWDTLVNRENLYAVLLEMANGAKSLPLQEAQHIYEKAVLPPVGNQEVWAAGVTYLRSRDARMEESKVAGGADFYDKVYEAERPELFFKSMPHRVVAHGQEVYIRRDSTWNVPEPELTLFINSSAVIAGYTIGNDMSSRSIEGENPLYLPQAKVYEKSAALGPCLYVPEQPLSPADTTIAMSIHRGGAAVYNDSVQVSRMKRTLPELAAFLYREYDLPYGSFLMTGTCLVPPNDFTLQEKDIINISITGIGTLTNQVSYKPLK